MKKTAIVTGSLGQDGSFLTKLLLNKNYKVVCIVRPSSNINFTNHDILCINKKNVIYEYIDLNDHYSMFKLISNYKPNEVYNLGAKTFVKDSFDNPISTFAVNTMSTLFILETIKILNLKCKFYQASSSEMFGKNIGKSLNEKSSFNPVSPYAVSKTSSYYLTKYYRQAYDIFAVNGLLFNHESHLRGTNFITRKVTKGLVDVKKNKKKYLEIGNIYAERDWGHAQDYMDAIFLMMQHKSPDDFVVATGKKYSVKQLVEYVSKKLEYDIVWKIDKQNNNFLAYDKTTSKLIIKSNNKHFRKAEVDSLLGNISKIKTILKWEPKIKFYKMLDQMIDFDLKN